MGPTGTQTCAPPPQLIVNLSKSSQCQYCAAARVQVPEGFELKVVNPRPTNSEVNFSRSPGATFKVTELLMTSLIIFDVEAAGNLSIKVSNCPAVAIAAIAVKSGWVDGNVNVLENGVPTP